MSWRKTASSVRPKGNVGSARSLGAARLETLRFTIGRRTFISHALAGGRTLAEVRDAAGHANVSITSGYLHVAVDDPGSGICFRIRRKFNPVGDSIRSALV
jgi:integrase